MSAAELTNLVGRLETVTFKLEKMAYQQSNISSSGVGETVPPTVLEYDRIISGPLKNFLMLSAAIGNEVKKQADMVNAAFQAQRQFLVIASKSKEPPQNVLITLLKPTSDQIQAIQTFRECNRSSIFFNHLSAISESISALGWVTVSPTPGPFVKEMSDASQFYTNRVLKDYKDKDKIHVDWTRAWLQVLSELQAYIKQHFTTGLTWNPKGCDANSNTPSVLLPPSSGAPPPPPPPLPPPEFFADSTINDTNDARAALFREINQGQDITKGLRKVTSEQQTHKNPTLRQHTGPVPKLPSTAARPFKPVAAPVQTKPPRFELEGKKWCIDYQVGNRGLIVSQTEMNQSVIAYKCQDCLITVKGKINSITLDSCKKTCIVFDDLVSFVEFINCQSVQAQSMGKVPTIAIDKTDGVLVYLSPMSLDAEIVTSKSSEVNVSIPQGDGDYIEHPIPEQFKSIWTGKGMKTVAVESK
uniref:Adenylate cyclase-associated protein n=1 Tax=Hadrurus spadix TaxID=141984 RepID=A0A1W7RB49_9SCOR